MTTPTMQDMFTWFKMSPAGEKLQRETVERHESERRVLATEIAELTKRHQAESPKLVTRERKAKEAYESALEALKKAEGLYQRAHAVVSSASSVYSSKVGQLEQQLRASADPAIDKFIEELRTTLNAERRRGADSEERGSGMFHRLTGNPISEVYSNQRTFSARLAGLREAIDHQVPALKLEVGVNVGERIDQVRAAIRV